MGQGVLVQELIMGEMVGWTILVVCATPVVLLILIPFCLWLFRSPEQRADDRARVALNAAVSRERREHQPGAMRGDGGVRDPG